LPSGLHPIISPGPSVGPSSKLSLSSEEYAPLGFELFRVGAENMFQVQAAFLVAIESSVLNVPGAASSFRRDVVDRAGVDLEVREPGELRLRVVFCPFAARRSIIRFEPRETIPLTFKSAR
jgi:hypothetical protein